MLSSELVLGANHAVWSLATSQYTPLSAVALQSLCKHAPLLSITTTWSPAPVRRTHQLQRRKGDTGLDSHQHHHGRCLAPQLLQPQQQQAETKVLQPAAFLGFDSKSCTSDLHQDVCPSSLASSSLGRTGTIGTQSSSDDLLSLGQTDAALQWQIVAPSVQDLLPDLRQLIAAHNGTAAVEVNLSLGAFQGSGSSGVQLDKATVGQQQSRLAAWQPAALNKLIAVARYRREVTDSELTEILQQVQQHMLQLPLYQLAYAAWAAAEISQLHRCSQDWLQHLYSTAAAQHFNQVSSVVDEAAAATLLQALVKLEQLPSQQWLAQCCDSLAIHQWHDPRALSTVAACLPQLGYVPDDNFRKVFFMASAMQLSAFPAISTARMFHGVMAWSHLHQQRLSERQHHPHNQNAAVHIPDSWLVSVLQQLCTHSSHLKPAEIAMVLQAMHRLQQQCQLAASHSQQGHELLVPVLGQQPATHLQQISQQLLHVLLAAVVQQLPRFKCKDLTVMLFSVSGLLQQQSSTGTSLEKQKQTQYLGVQWSWLRQVLSAAQLQQLDARGQATCLAAASMLIKPHLQLQQQQTKSAPPTAASEGRAGELNKVKPLQRWLHLQEQQQLQPTAPQQATTPPATPVRISLTNWPIALPAGGHQHHDDVGSFWQEWLVKFYHDSSNHLESFSCEDLTVIVCALASLRQVPPVDWYERMLDAVQLQLPPMSAGQAAGIAWSLGTMALLPSQHDDDVALVPEETWMRRLCLQHGAAQLHQPQLEGEKIETSSRHVSPTFSSYSASEVVRLMWATAVCECDMGDAWWTAAEGRLLRLAADDHSRHSRWSSNLTADDAADQRPQQMLLSLQLLSLLLQAYTAAGRTLQPELLKQLFLQPAVFHHQLLPASISAVAALLKSFARCHCELPGEWLHQLVGVLQPRLAALEPRELLQLLGGLAAVGFHPHLHQTLQSESLKAARAADSSVISSGPPSSPGQIGVNRSDISWPALCLAVSQQKMQHMSASDVSFLMWMVVKLHLKPPAPWIEAALNHIQADFLDVPPSAPALAITAVSKLGYMPSSDWMAAFLMATHRKAAAMAADPCSNKLLLARLILMTLWALADLRVRDLSPKWLKLMLLTVHQQLPLLQPHHSLALLQVLARLQCRPSSVYLQSLLDHMGPCSLLSSSELVKVVYAAASLRWRPSKGRCQQFLAASASSMTKLDPQGLALLHWSLAVIKVTPLESWKDAAAAAVMLQLDVLNATDISMIVWSWGKLQIHVTPRQELSRAARRTCRRHFSLWLQQRWKQQASDVDGALLQQQQQLSQPQQQELQQPQQQQQQQRVWRHHWVRQQWQVWQQLQQPSQLVLFAGSGSIELRQLVSDRVLAAASALRGTYSMSSLVYLLVGIARLQLRPSQDWMHCMVMQGSAEKVSVLNGLQLQQLVWALGKLGYRAGQQWLDGVAVLLEVAWQESDYIRHSAAAAVERLQQIVLPSDCDGL